MDFMEIEGALHWDDGDCEDTTLDFTSLKKKEGKKFQKFQAKDKGGVGKNNAAIIDSISQKPTKHFQNSVENESLDNIRLSKRKKEKRNGIGKRKEENNTGYKELGEHATKQAQSKRTNKQKLDVQFKGEPDGESKFGKLRKVNKKKRKARLKEEGNGVGGSRDNLTEKNQEKSGRESISMEEDNPSRKAGKGEKRKGNRKNEEEADVEGLAQAAGSRLEVEASIERNECLTETEHKETAEPTKGKRKRKRKPRNNKFEGWVKRVKLGDQLSKEKDVDENPYIGIEKLNLDVKNNENGGNSGRMVDSGLREEDETQERKEKGKETGAGGDEVKYTIESVVEHGSRKEEQDRNMRERGKKRGAAGGDVEVKYAKGRSIVKRDSRKDEQDRKMRGRGIKKGAAGGDVEVKCTKESMVEYGSGKDEQDKEMGNNRKQILAIEVEAKGEKYKRTKTKKTNQIKNGVIVDDESLPSKIDEVGESDDESSDISDHKGKMEIIYAVTKKKKRKNELEINPKQSWSHQLRSARFRFINETLYKSTGEKAFRTFKWDRSSFEVYHEGYKQQVEQWPENPVDVMIKYLQKRPQNWIVGDFGCGEAQIAQHVKQRVHSFDIFPSNDKVTVCNISKVPLKAESLNVAVYCLSLMGTNWIDYLREANRVLETGGHLKIAEVASRFMSIDYFVNVLKKLGFSLKSQDLNNKMFFLFDFEKTSKCKTVSAAMASVLKPCVYKRR